MKNLFIVLIMLVSSIGSAQTFDFSCAAGDANGIVTHDGFETYDTGNTLYGSDRYPNYIIRLVTFNGNVFFRTERINPRQSRRNFGEGTYQQRYDAAVADIKSVATPAFYRINIDVSLREHIDYLVFFGDNGRIGETFTHGDDIPDGATRYIIQGFDINNGSDGTITRGPVVAGEDLDLCFSIPRIQPGLGNPTGLKFVRQIDLDGTIYDRGDVLPAGYYNVVKFRDGAATIVTLAGISIPCGVYNVTTDTSPGLVLHAVEAIRSGATIENVVYNFAGKTWDVNGTENLSFTSGPFSFNIARSNIGIISGRLTFNGYVYLYHTDEPGLPYIGFSPDRGPNRGNTNHTAAMERAVPLIESGVKRFFANGDTQDFRSREEAFFAIESMYLATDANNLNRHIVDSTPISGVSLITGLSSFPNPVEGGYYIVNQDDRNILVLRQGSNWHLRSGERFDSTQEGFMWQIKDPGEIDDGDTKYVYIQNQRAPSGFEGSLHSQASGWFSVNTAISGGRAIDIGDNEGRFRGEVTTGDLDNINYYVNQTYLAEPGLRPGDYVVMRNNHAAGGYAETRSGARGFVVLRMIARVNGTIRYVPVYSYDTFDPGYRIFGGDAYVVRYAAQYLGSNAILK